jgi:serine/threonine protein kinase
VQLTGRKVAIKKVTNAFNDVVELKHFLRELTILHHLNGHENIVSVLDVMVTQDDRGIRDICIVFPFMETDLHQVLSSKQQLTDKHIQWFMYQIFSALKYIHSANVRL